MARIKFDSVQLGDLEVGWWKAHNDKDKPRMIKLLVQYSIAMYGFSEDEAKNALQKLVEGESYHDTREWGKAVEAVTSYYKEIRDKTGLPFNSKAVAELEVGWWQLHDELANNPDKTQLARAFAKLYAAQFGIDSSLLDRAGKLKAEAAREHDLAEDLNTPEVEVDMHWDKANKYLISFYTELAKVID